MNTVYVERDDDRQIRGVYGSAQPDRAEEEMPGDDPAVVAFLAALDAAVPAPRNPLAEIDALKADLAQMKAGR